MATIRTVTATADGIAHVDVNIPAGAVVIVAEPGRTRAEAIVVNRSDDPAADAMVEDGTVQAAGTTLTIRTAPPPATFVVGDMAGGNIYGSMHMAGHPGQGRINAGIMAFDDGQINIVGSIVAGSVSFGQGAHAGDTTNIGAVSIGAQADLEVTVYIPENSSVEVTSGAASIITRGKLGHADLKTSGAIRVEHVGTIHAGTNGGSVRIAHFTHNARVTANGGSVQAFGADDAVLDVTANGGNVVYGRNLDASVTANGGSVRAVKP